MLPELNLGYPVNLEATLKAAQIGDFAEKKILCFHPRIMQQGFATAKQLIFLPTRWCRKRDRFCDGSARAASSVAIDACSHLVRVLSVEVAHLSNGSVKVDDRGT